MTMLRSSNVPSTRVSAVFDSTLRPGSTILQDLNHAISSIRHRISIYSQ
jgi:hypothetical protein